MIARNITQETTRLRDGVATPQRTLKEDENNYLHAKITTMAMAGKEVKTYTSTSSVLNLLYSGNDLPIYCSGLRSDRIAPLVVLIFNPARKFRKPQP